MKVLPTFNYTRQVIDAKMIKKQKLRERPSPRQQKNSSPLYFSFLKSRFQKTFGKRKSNTHGIIEKKKA